MFRAASVSNARKTLMGIWFFFFLVNIACIFYLYLDNWIESDNFRASLQQLNSLYVAYLGMIVTFYLTQPNQTLTNNKHVLTTLVIVSLSSILWNTFIFIFFFRLVLQCATIEDSLRQISFFGPLLSWLVAPAIGYYF